MKNKFALLVLAVLMLGQAGMAVFAEEEPGSISSEGGPLTRSGHPAWKIASYPLRLATGTGGIVVGAIISGSKNIVKTEQEFAKNTYGQAAESPALYPVGVLGSLVAVPIGFVTGMPQGASTGAREGFKVWDHL